MRNLHQKHEDLRRATRQTVVEYEGMSELSAKVLTDIVLSTMKKYQQKLNVGVEDSVSDLLDGFKQKVVETMFDTAGSWQIAVRPPILFPKGCRHCYTRGQSTVVVIEQDPQVRSLLFDEDVLARDSVARRASLSLPYVIFVIHFKENRFCGLYSGWRTSPLRNLNDMLCRPLLPNIHPNLSVCMGNSRPVEEENISQTCESIISSFWNSQFNRDLASMWASKDLYHDNLASGVEWERASIENPMFILDIHLPEEKSIQYMIDLLVINEETPDISSLRHQLSEELDDCSRRLFSRLMRYFKNTKFEKHFPKSIDDQLKSAMQNAMGEFSDLVVCLESEIEDLKNSVKKTNHFHVEKRSPYWQNYSS